MVESVRQVQAPVRDNSDHLIGTIAGGVAGGVVGNQFGGGNGKTALTVLGAVGGALAGREVERNIRQQQTVTHYELTVRMSDGSAVKSAAPSRSRLRPATASAWKTINCCPAEPGGRWQPSV